MSNRLSGLVGLFLVSVAAFTFAQAFPVSEFEGVVPEADYQTRVRLTRTIVDGDLLLELSGLTSTAQMECDFGDREASCDTDFGAQAELTLEAGSLVFELGDQVLEFQKRSGDPNRWPGVYRIPDYADTEIPEVVIPDDPAGGVELNSWDREETLRTPPLGPDGRGPYELGPGVSVTFDPADEQAMLTTEDGAEVRLRLMWSGIPLAAISRPRAPSLRELSVSGPPARVTERFTGLPDPDSSFVFAEELVVAESRDFDLAGGVISAISPDGAYIVGVRDGVLVVTDVATGDDQSIRSPVRITAPHNVRWSPDGSRFLYTGDVFVRLEDGDVMMGQPGQSSLTVLTPDDADTLLDAAVPEAPLDMTPFWTSNTRIVFQRVVDDGAWRAVLHEIALDAPDPQPLAPLEFPRMSVVHADFAPTTGAVFLTAVDPGRGEVSGIWALEPGRSEAVQLLSSRSAGETVILLDVNPDGEFLLATTFSRFGFGDRGVLLDVTAGDQLPLAPEGGMVTAATFSPDGSKYIVAYLDTDGVGRVIVRDLFGQSERELLADAPLISTGHELYGGQGVQWTHQDSVLLVTERGRGAILLQLQARR